MNIYENKRNAKLHWLPRRLICCEGCCDDGCCDDGCLDGCRVGFLDGCVEGCIDGCFDGWWLGCRVGSDEGWVDGVRVGWLVGREIVCSFAEMAFNCGDGLFVEDGEDGVEYELMEEEIFDLKMSELVGDKVLDFDGISVTCVSELSRPFVWLDWILFSIDNSKFISGILEEANNRWTWRLYNNIAAAINPRINETCFSILNKIIIIQAYDDFTPHF